MAHKPIPQLTDSDLKRFWSKVRKSSPDDCWLWEGTIVNEYGQFKMKDGFGYKVNRISYALKYGDPKKLCVCHTCDTPLCVNPLHLWAGTIQEDMEDKVNKGRQSRGMFHGRAKLTENDVRAILASNEDQWDLANHYGVWQSAISKIKRGITWKHIER